MIGNWISAINHLFERNESFVLITLLSARGSTPRGTDSKMVVTGSETYDSIGGGNLEFQITAKSREMLAGEHPKKTVEEFPLGATLGQCCGGQVTVLFEYFPATRFNVVLFGGGHVATALAKILVELPCKIQWLDSRDEFAAADVPGVELKFHETPEMCIDEVSAGTSFLVMTHDHALDYVLSEKILARQQRQKDVNFCGLIGSKSKANKFRKRLAYKGFDASIIDQLKCPIGLADIPGKRPMEVAVSIAAELIQLHAETSSTHSAPEYNVARKKLLKLISSQ